MYIVARGIHQGRSAALVSALGVEVGALIHVAGATLGVSAVLASSALAFSVVKYLGAAYLIYFAVRTLLDRSAAPAIATGASTSLGRIFWQGVVVELLNPKTILFFLAFLPQFVEPGRGPVEWQILILGALFVMFAICIDGLYGLFAGSLGDWLGGNARFLSTQRYFSGGVYVVLALTTALAGPGR